MKEFLGWLMGLPTFPDGAIETIRLRFLFLPEGYGVAVCLAFSIAALGFAFWIYLKRRRVLGRRRWGLMALRVTALCLLFALLLGPHVEVVCTDTTRSTVAILVDDSQSMTIVDKRPTAEAVERTAKALGLAPSVPDRQKQAREATRLSVLRAALGGDAQGLVADLNRTFAVKMYRFGRNAIAGPASTRGLGEWLAGCKGTEEATQLGSGLASVLEDLRGQAVAGVVVLSDGSSNGGTDPGEVLARAGKRAIPVYFVGLGEADARDVQVSYVAMRDIMFLDDPAPVSVKLRHWGCAGRRVRLSVSDGTAEVASSEVELTEAGESTELLTIKPQRKGTLTYTVKAEPMDGELILDNNEKRKDVRVVDEKIKVLWVETVPRWEYRYAKNLLKRDQMRFDAKIMLFEADAQIRDKEGLFLERFPEKDSELFSYHLVVIGDIEAARLSESDMKRLRQYVSKEGGSVVFLAGSVFGPGVWNRTPLEDLLPVVAQPIGSQHWRTEVTAPVVRPLRVRRTVLGERHPFLAITDDREVTRSAWEKYLLLYNRIPVEKAKPGAQVLLETVEEVPRPVVVSSRFGSGTVLYIGSDELWRWRYRPGPLTHDRFWGNVLQQTALARLLGESRRVTLQIEREEVGVGDAQTLTARVLTEGYQPALDESMEVMVGLEEQGRVTERTQVRLASLGGGMGLYEGKFLPNRAGRYSAELVYGKEKGTAVFRASPPQIEFENPALDREKLLAWARLTGGNVYDPSDLAGLPEELKNKARAAVIRVEDELWDAPLWAFLFVLLAGAEWYWRKRENLP
jgi:hypothetical protein